MFSTHRLLLLLLLLLVVPGPSAEVVDGCQVACWPWNVWLLLLLLHLSLLLLISCMELTGPDVCMRGGACARPGWPCR